MDLPGNLRYSESHEWVQAEGDVARVGITDFAQNELGDVVFVELPAPGRQLQKDDIFGSIESVKAVSDLIAPITGEVLEANANLEGDPAIVNGSPYSDAWMLKVRIDKPEEMEGLMTAEQYKEFVEES
jgi:glycine cleavage system H protein